MQTINIKSIDAYLKTVTPAQKATLEHLRNVIKEAAPKAEETISYGMPAFKYMGPLVYFAAFTNHCSFFPGGGAAQEVFKDELKDYKTSKGTIQFTLDKPLPDDLIKKIVIFRVHQNEEKMALKKMKK